METCECCQDNEVTTYAGAARVCHACALLMLEYLNSDVIDNDLSQDTSDDLLAYKVRRAFLKRYQKPRNDPISN